MTVAAAPKPPARYPHGVPSPRAKRPYEELQPTQKWKRRKKLQTEVAAAVERVGCPLEAINPPPVPPPAELIHLSTAVREQIRTVPSLHIPCEQSMINCKQLLATTHATETGTFAGGAFITDPVRFVSVLCAQSSFIAVGGDAGGGRAAASHRHTLSLPQRRLVLHQCCAGPHGSLRHTSMPHLHRFSQELPLICPLPHSC